MHRKFKHLTITFYQDVLNNLFFKIRLSGHIQMDECGIVKGVNEVKETE